MRRDHNNLADWVRVISDIQDNEEEFTGRLQDQLNRLANENRSGVIQLTNRIQRLEDHILEMSGENVSNLIDDEAEEVSDMDTDSGSSSLVRPQ